MLCSIMKFVEYKQNSLSFYCYFSVISVSPIGASAHVKMITNLIPNIGQQIRKPSEI